MKKLFREIIGSIIILAIVIPVFIYIIKKHFPSTSGPSELELLEKEKVKLEIEKLKMEITEMNSALYWW